MKERGKQFEDLPFELTQISKPARNYLKILAIGLLQYHKDLPARDPDVFPSEKGAGDNFHNGTSGQD